ncbi:MAG: xanthine phosphoribosyltransferase [Alphaproteobacteria bacterium]|nr:xanthine phosphoribosyltransferase [Alphaproteobacteria bacterium]
MSDYTSDIYLSWDDVQNICRDLARRIHVEHPQGFNKILAITRGGMFPAGIIARELNIRLIDTVSIASYDEQNRHEPRIIKDCHPDFMDGALVIDDLSDTGTTLRLLKTKLTNAKFATLFVKPSGAELVDWFGREAPQSTWVRFPWDTVRQYATPLVCDRIS